MMEETIKCCICGKVLKLNSGDEVAELRKHLKECECSR
jgi:hypothetical protein